MTIFNLRWRGERLCTVAELEGCISFLLKTETNSPTIVLMMMMVVMMMMTMTMMCRSLTSSRSVERICGKDGRWGPGLPKCRGDYHFDSFKNICGVDGDDGASDDINDDDDDDDYWPWHALYLGHLVPRDPLSTNQC